jgi:hypothetical protein
MRADEWVKQYQDDDEQLMADWRVGCKERIGPSQTTSILRSEIPPWALKLIIVTAIVLWLTW